MTEGAPAERIIARNFLALVSGEAIARMVAFAGTIYLARTLGAAGYGVLGFALAVILYLSRIADGGMEFFGLGIREIAEDHSRINHLAPDLITARLLISATLALVLIVVGLSWPAQPDGLVLGLYGLTLLAVGGGTRWVHLGLESTKFVAAARTIGELTALLLILTLVRSGADIARVPLAQLTGDSLAAVLLAVALRRRQYSIPLRLHLERALPIFKRSAPLVLTALLGLIVYNSDLIFLRFFRDAAHVGYYAAAYTLVSFMTNLGGTYTQSLTPTLTRVGTEGNRTGLYHSAIAHVLAVSLPVAVGGSILAPQIIHAVFGPDYVAQSGIALQLLLWSVPLALLREVNIVALVVSGSQTRVLRLTAYSAALNIMLNLLLIPRIGIPGAAIATCVTEVFRVALAFSFAGHAGFRLVPASRLWRTLLATAVMLIVLLVIRPKLLPLAVAMGATSYSVTLALVGGLRLRPGQLPALSV